MVCSGNSALACGVCSRNLQAPFDISLGLIPIQRIKPSAKSNPLLQLSEPDRIQFLIKFRLADQYDLQQLIFRGLQVRQKANLLKYFRGQMVRFVHDEYGSQLLRSPRDQELAQVKQQLAFVLTRSRKPEVGRMYCRNSVGESRLLKRYA